MSKHRARSQSLFPDELQALVGATFVHKLTDVDDAPLRIGSDVFTRHQLGSLIGVTNTIAARSISRVAASIGAKNVKHLYQNSTPYTFVNVEHRCGETGIYVLWRLFEWAGLDPDAWATAGDRDAAVVTFRTLKLRERAAEKRTPKKKKAS